MKLTATRSYEELVSTRNITNGQNLQDARLARLFSHKGGKSLPPFISMPNVRENNEAALSHWFYEAQVAILPAVQNIYFACPPVIKNQELAMRDI